MVQGSVLLFKKGAAVRSPFSSSYSIVSLFGDIFAIHATLNINVAITLAENRHFYTVSRELVSTLECGNLLSGEPAFLLFGCKESRKSC